MRKIGILGGTFDPPHIGHLRIAEEAKELFNLNKVILIPTRQPEHKKIRMNSFNSRCTMVRAALGSTIGELDMNNIEIITPVPSHTIDTIRALKAQYKRWHGNTVKIEFYFIVGTDQFNTITEWKSYKRLLYLTNFIVIPRDADYYTNQSHKLPLRTHPNIHQETLGENDDLARIERYKNSTKRIYYTWLRSLPISSTMIRKYVKEDRSIRYLVPERVESFIRAEKLYKI